MIDEGCLIDIEVLNYTWKSSLLYISGHYEFEINLSFKNDNGKISRRLIARRFSDFEILHEGLMKLNPGCKIPQLPEKSIWCNLYLNNDNALEKRKNQIGEYLKYILIHKFLKNNSIFLIFISEELENYKNFLAKNKKGIDSKKMFEFLKTVKKNYLPSSINKILTPFSSISAQNLTNNNEIENKKFIKNQNNENEYIIFDFETEKENILRLDRGVSDLIITLEKYVKLFEERTNSLKNIFDLTKNLDNSFISLKNYKKTYSNESNEIKNFNEVHPMQNNQFKAEFELNKNNIFEKLFEKNRSYKDNINLNILDRLKIYSSELDILKDIIKRRDTLVEENYKNSDMFEFLEHHSTRRRKKSLNFIDDQCKIKMNYSDKRNVQSEEINNFKKFHEEENGGDNDLDFKSSRNSIKSKGSSNSLNENSYNDEYLKNFFNQYIFEFREEIIYFKENKEKEIVEILKKFFDYKIQMLNELNINTFSK